MASPSQSTPTSSHFSIRSIISPDDLHLARLPDSPGTHATAPNSAPSLNRYDSGSEPGSYTSSHRPLLASPTSADVIELHYHQNQTLLPHQRDHLMQQQFSYQQHPQQQRQQHYRQQPPPPPPQQQQQLLQHQLPSISSVSPLPPLAPPSTLPVSHVQTTQSNQDDQQRVLQRRVPEGHPTLVNPHVNASGRALKEAPEEAQVSGSPSTYGYLSPPGAPDSPPGGVIRKPAVLKRAPMRSSIACIRCRRSKIKCVNNGEGKAACETCVKSRRNCDYPVSSNQAAVADTGLQFVYATAAKAPVTLKREDPGSTDRNSERKRVKKVDDSYRLDDQKIGAYNANELLSEQFLKEMMWTEIFDIYHLHFSTELPFIHMPTLKEKMGDKMRQHRSEATNLVLLGILTLTARFHSDLGKYTASFIANGSKMRTIAPTKIDPWAASEYFADTLTRALGPFRTSVSIASVEHVQALLMLGLYEWTQSQRKNAGMSAWMTVGFAVRMAQGLGLSYQGEARRRHRRFPPTESSSQPVAGAEVTTQETGANVEDEDHTATAARTASSLSYNTTTAKDGSSLHPARLTDKMTSIMAPDDIVASEVVRRTMFSCFVLDRMLACGKKRTKMVRSKDLQIQLPCSEVSFDLSEKVQTGYLRPRKSKSGIDSDSPVASTDSLLARFIRLVDIWGDISKYSFAGGRLVDKRPPWEASKFRRLRGVLDDFYESLPPTFTLSPSNYHRHEHLQASSTYVSLHMLGAVCRIMLHREYIPFIPIRCPRPMGPLDEPTFPDGSAPEGFWDDSAEQVFKAAREIVDLAETCQKRKKMPMSALVVFAVWTAAFVGIYAWHFPQLDVQRHMFSVEETCRIQGRRSRGDKDRGYRVATHGPTSIAYTALKSMSNYLHMASTYVKYFHDMDLFYEGVKNDYLAHLEQNGGDAAERMSVRQGGNGGGLDEWKLYGPKVTNNGTILLAEDTPAEGSELSREAIRSDKDNETAESDLTPAKDHSLKPRWIAPAGSSATIAMASPVAISSTGEHQPATGTVGDTIMKDRNNGIVAEVPTAPDGTMHGIVYGDESDAQFSQGNIGSGSANSGSLQPNEAQKWNTFSHATEQLHQMSYLDSQNAMPFAQVDSLDSTPPDVLLGDDSVNDFREFFNLNIAESQGMRWENVPATSINRFAEGGPEVEYVEGNMPLVYIGMADTYGM